MGTFLFLLAWTGAPATTIGGTVGEFTLEDYRGRQHALRDFGGRPVVLAVLGTECPLAKLYAARLVGIAKEYSERGVAFVGLFPNRQDSRSDIADFARKEGIEFPLLKDAGHRVADALAAERTPEVFLLDADHVIRYRGRVDDQFDVGVARPKPTREYLKDALEDLLNGKSIRTSSTPATGCVIGRVRLPQANAQVTYSHQIARLLQDRCIECHRHGQIAPFALDRYEEAVGWAEMIREVVDDGRMPPWHADPAHGRFANDSRLTDDEKDLIHRWVEAGAPEGDPMDLPDPPVYVEGWRIKPDAVYTFVEPFVVPATGVVEYQYRIVDPGFTEDKWVQAAEANPGNRSVVHHIICFVLPPGAGTDEGSLDKAFMTDFLVGMAPGAPPQCFPEGSAKLIRAGSRIVFQLHYTPNGTQQSDQSSIGLVFADPKTVRRHAYTHAVGTELFEIPPGDPDYKVQSAVRFRDDTLLLTLIPHMHLRGKSFRYVATYPDGRDEILLDVPRYDFRWQNTYIFEEPKLLPKGTRLRALASFDNSPENPNNPDPTKRVRFGDQTWEEMMLGFFQMVRAHEDRIARPQGSRTEQFAAIASRGELHVDEEIRSRAAVALRSEDDFARLWDLVNAKLPQLDRMDVTFVNGFKLDFTQIVASEDIWPTLNDRDIHEQIGANGPLLALYTYAIQKKPVVNHDMKNVKGVEMRFLGFIFPSSAHIPIQHKGKVGTLNVWSLDDNAFPAEAVQFLTDVVARMGESQGR